MINAIAHWTNSIEFPWTLPCTKFVWYPTGNQIKSDMTIICRCIDRVMVCAHRPIPFKCHMIYGDHLFVNRLDFNAVAKYEYDIESESWRFSREKLIASPIHLWWQNLFHFGDTQFLLLFKSTILLFSTFGIIDYYHFQFEFIIQITEKSILQFNSFSYPAHCFNLIRVLVEFFSIHSNQYNPTLALFLAYLFGLMVMNDWNLFAGFYFDGICIQAHIQRENTGWNRTECIIFMAKMVDVSLQVCIIVNSSKWWQYRMCLCIQHLRTYFFCLCSSALFSSFYCRITVYWLCISPFFYI